MKEKNISVFNADVASNQGYLYSQTEKLSCRFSNRRTSKAIEKMVGSLRGKAVIDIGCGDGKYTRELLALNPVSIVGMDASEAAIEVAKINHADVANMHFEVMSIYDLPPEKKYDVAIVRGMLHHLYEVEKAIDAVCKIAKEIIVVEPNGYNPVLKIIEKTSPYHIAHEEKSYAPKNLDKWFKQSGGKIVNATYVGLVPMFCPDMLARIFKIMEPVVERLPLLRKIACGQYVQKIAL